MKNLRLPYTAVTLLILVSPVFAGTNDGLVASYPFNGNANEATGAGPDGTVFGATPTEDRFGNADSAYHFDGVNDYINIGNTLTFPAWDTYSVSVWFLNDGGGDTTSGYGQKIISKNTFFSDFHLNVYPSPPGILQFISSQGQFDYINDLSHNYRDNTWHHAVINKSSYTDGELWVDGVLKGSSNQLDQVVNNVDVLIGYSASADGLQRRFWSGKIDDIRIYNRSLTEDEIGELFTEISVEIDIKPFNQPDKPNRVQLPPPMQRVKVQILSTNTASGESVDFDALQVDPTTVRFGPWGASPILRYVQVVDKDRDGDKDLFMKFNTYWTGIKCTDTEATLTGETYAGESFTGTDSVSPYPCPKIGHQ